jgi:hypothetical protein
MGDFLQRVNSENSSEKIGILFQVLPGGFFDRVLGMNIGTVHWVFAVFAVLFSFPKNNQKNASGLLYQVVHI